MLNKDANGSLNSEPTPSTLIRQPPLNAINHLHNEDPEDFYNKHIEFLNNYITIEKSLT